MPAPKPADLGPLEPIIGTWEGDQGMDVAYGNAEGTIIRTPYRERLTLSPLGPIDNGSQQLFGLDYRTAAWREGEEDPFHTEVGYWLWDAEDGQVMRCFMIPRGSTVLAGGPAAVGDRTLSMVAEVGSESYGILANRYLTKTARSIKYELTVDLNDDGSWSYESTTTIEHVKHHELVLHTDRNTLHRVAD